jgi:hypothetical protein
MMIWDMASIHYEKLRLEEPSPIDVAATPSPSFPAVRGGAKVTSTVRGGDGGGGGGGGEATYMMMGDTASIHSEKLRVEDQPS